MNKKKLKYLISGLGIIVVCSIFFIYQLFFSINIRPGNDRAVILIQDGASYDQVMDSVRLHLKIGNLRALRFVSMKKGYPDHIRPGRYVITNGLSCNGLINILRGGRQSPVHITFSNIRSLNDLAGKVGGQIEADSLQIIAFLSDSENYGTDGFSIENVISVFIPDTYEFYWNTQAEGFYSRMLREYRKFWTREKLEKAKVLNLTPIEVSVLASIVDAETSISEEKPRIAGVYINRIKQGIPLQADPTIKFAVNDFTIARILKKHLQIDSPYNTYKYSGIPPGPIGCPTVEGIDAVLNAEKHTYLFFAARADFSGYHNFSRTLSEHNRYAAQYQKELNMRKIFR